MPAEHAGTGQTALPGQMHRAIPVRPRLFILSGIRLLREGVTAALAGQPTVQVVGAADLAIPTEEIAACAPDAILLDICLPGVLEIAAPFRNAMPDAKIVALGVPEDAPVVMACARAGVAGFVHPQGSAHDVVMAVHSAVRGELVCSPRTAAILLSQVTAAALPAGPDCARATPPPATAPLAGPAGAPTTPVTSSISETLTPREQEILALVSDGLSNKQIARQLAIGNATVKNHVHSILGKLGVQRRGEAAARRRRLEPSWGGRPVPDHSARTG